MSVQNIYNPFVAIGNPDLKPFAATNVDFGVEGCFELGSVLSLEVFYQEPFDGLGAMASFTYVAGTRNGPGTGFTANDGAFYRMQLRGLSAYSYGATTYYEKDGINLRLSYSWRSKTPSDDSLANLNYYNTNTRLWTRARGSLDLTVGCAFDDWVEIRFDVSNLLNEQEIAYLIDGTGKNSQIEARAAGFGVPMAHVFYDYVHGSNYLISVRGRL